MPDPATPKPKIPTMTTREIVDAYEARDIGTNPKFPYGNSSMVSRLKELMRTRKSPKAGYVIKYMEKDYDYVLKRTYKHGVWRLMWFMENFNPDRITRRAVYLQLLGDIRELEAEIKQLYGYCERLNLTNENTKLSPEPALMTAWYESQRREALQKAQYARTDRAARRRIRARAAKSKAASPPVAKTKETVGNKT